ncbi:hypothetical protein [Enterobacter hormaechei]|uniref:hypothetical protein n=1 Tax=Enterobacter hormaechei TaxID=158836 RepID=UPI0007965EA1|nr:hypothetical protein [Enterobacter hormaechei]CZW09904.1 Uncharacterised protein [Enterobacter hormaechei]CZW55860.1 Uncharacterised protein [Enterobacter hormaechei]SAG18052.1 Uncharacterised protein [Enterobacter hormaechei]
MSQKIFSAGRTIESVAYDIALALAAKDDSLNTAKEIIDRVESVMPACLQEAKAQYDKEHPYQDIGIFTRR